MKANADLFRINILNGEGYIMCYSIASRESFDAIDEICAEIKKIKSDQPIVSLIQTFLQSKTLNQACLLGHHS